MVNNFGAKEAVDKLIRYCTEHDCKTECAIRERCVEMKDKSYLFHLGPHKSPEEKTHAKDYIERMKDENQKLLEKWDKLNSFRCRHCTQLDETELYLTLTICIPSEQTMTKMMIANVLTTENIKSGTDFTQDKIGKLVDKIADAAIRVKEADGRR